MKNIRFDLRTGHLIINLNKCVKCTSYDCVKACSLYGRHLFRIEKNRYGPIPNYDYAEFKRRCIECLACEMMCLFGAIEIKLPLRVE